MIRYLLSEYIREGALPLFANRIPKGTHSRRAYHDHEYSELAIVAGGRAAHLLDGGSFPIERGDVLVLHPGMVHAYDDVADLELVNVAYDRTRLALPQLDGSSLPLFGVFFPPEKGEAQPRRAVEPVTRLEPAALDRVLTLADRLREEAAGVLPGNSFLCLALFMEIVTAVGRAGGCGVPVERIRLQVGDAVGYLNRNYASPVTVEELARVAKMSCRNFFRHFRNTVGCTPVEYLMRVRISRAAELLLFSDAGLNEIALRCGFCDGNYFCRKFREMKGITPRRFRLRAR